MRPALLLSLALCACAQSDGLDDFGVHADFAADLAVDLAASDGGSDLRSSCDLDAGSGERLFVAATDTGGQPWAALFSGGAWSAVAIGGGAMKAVIATDVAGRPVAIGRRSDDTLVSAIYDPCTATLGTPTPLFSLALTAERPAAVGGDLIDVVFRGSLSGDQRLYRTRFDGTWQAATTLGNFLSTLPPTAVREQAEVHAIFTGTDGNVYDGLVDTNGGAATQLAGASSDRGPAVASAADGTTWIVYKATDTNLMWTERSPGGGYAAPQQLCAGQSGCLIASDEAPALALDRAGAPIAAWIGKGDGLVYTARLPAAGSTWSAAAAASTEATSLLPALAPGLAGVDVELVYVRGADGKGRHVRLAGGAFSTPIDLPGAAMGTQPSLVSID